MRWNGTSTSAAISFFLAAAAARLGLGYVPKLGLGSSARPWLLFKRAHDLRGKPTRGTRATGARLRVESSLDTRWKKVLTGGPHLSVTQGRGTRSSLEEEREGVLARA